MARRCCWHRAAALLERAAAVDSEEKQSTAGPTPDSIDRDSGVPQESLQLEGYVVL